MYKKLCIVIFIFSNGENQDDDDHDETFDDNTRCFGMKCLIVYDRNRFYV